MGEYIIHRQSAKDALKQISIMSFFDDLMRNGITKITMENPIKNQRFDLNLNNMAEAMKMVKSILKK